MQVIQQIVPGIAMGAIYASVALALVIARRATGVFNFAQGELAMLSAYLAWYFHGSLNINIYLSILYVLIIAFLLGMAIERAVMSRFLQSDEITGAIVTIGLLLFFHSLAGGVWGYQIYAFPDLFGFLPGGIDIAGAIVNSNDLGIIAVMLFLFFAFYALINWTKVGLGLRAVASNFETSRLLGLRVGLLLALGWGAAALVGAVAGIVAAPLLFLSPSMMSQVLIFALTGMVLGGVDSAVGAVVGGVIVGVAANLATLFLPSSMSVVLPVVLMTAILLIKPSGLFGSTVRARA